MRRAATKSCLYSEAVEDEMSDNLYAIDEEELTVHYAEDGYDSIAQVGIEYIPLPPLAFRDCSINTEIQITGADNMEPVATDSDHPNDKSLSVQVVEKEEERRSRPADLPDNTIIQVHEQLSPAAALLNDFFIKDDDELTVYYAEETHEEMVQVNFEDIPTCPLGVRFYSDLQITGTGNMQPVATNSVHPNDKSLSVQVVEKEEERRSRPDDLPENVIIRLPENFSEDLTDNEDEVTVYYVEEVYDKIVQVNIENIPRSPRTSMDSCIYSDIQFGPAVNINANNKSTQTDVQVIRRPGQMVQQQEDLIQVVQEQEPTIPQVNNEERSNRPQNIVIRGADELSTTTASSTLTARFIGVGFTNWRILSTDQLLSIATVCIFTALVMCLVFVINLIIREELFQP